MTDSINRYGSVTSLATLAGADLRVPARYYAKLLELAIDSGDERENLLASAGLAAAELEAATIALAAAARLVEAVLARSTQLHIGFELGRSFRPSDHELIGYALLSADTLADSMQLAARYWRLLTPVYTMSAVANASQLVLSWSPLARLPPALQRLHGEAIIAGVHNELRLLLDQSPGGELQLPAAWLRGRHPYASLTPTRCTPIRAEDDAVLRWILPAALGTQPLRLADQSGLARARVRCELLLRAMTADGSVAQWVQLMLAQATDRQPTQVELAGLLNLSARSLHRRLQAEGESFQQLALQQRMAIAQQLLRKSTLSLTEVGIRLGYSDAANFCRAFRRDCGLTPGQYRITNPAA